MMFCATRDYAAGLQGADINPLHDDILTLLGNNGFTIPGPHTGYIENGRVDGFGTYENWDIDAFSLSMTADDYTYSGGFATGAATLPVSNACRVTVAGDGIEGWFWVLIHDTVAAQILSLTAACHLLRHAVDEDHRLLGRWGMLWLPVDGPARCALIGGADISGTQLGELIMGTWSPLAGSLRHGASAYMPASSLPRMIAPLFPDPMRRYDAWGSPDTTSAALTACVPGEFDCVMRATDGYAMGEQAAPNWHVYGDATHGYYALRRPASMTTF